MTSFKTTIFLHTTCIIFGYWINKKIGLCISKDCSYEMRFGLCTSTVLIDYDKNSRFSIINFLECAVDLFKIF